MPPKNQPKESHTQLGFDNLAGSANVSPDPEALHVEAGLPSAETDTTPITAAQDAEYDRVDAQGWNNGTTTRGRAGMTEIDFSVRQPLKELSKTAVDNAVNAARAGSRRKPRVFRTHRDKRWGDEAPPHIRNQTGRK